jgi:4,5-dihydroxyphthalate decarboxylase
MNLSLTLACDHYDLMWPLIAGHIKPQGIDLRILTMGDERHDRMMQHGEFDACEIGLAPYFIAHENRNPVTAIPVFLRRMFLHRFIFVHANSKISSLEELKGKRVGIRRSANTLALWVKGLLLQQYGIASDQITWVAEKADFVEYKSRPKTSFEMVPTGENLEGLLDKGLIDAAILPYAIPALHRNPQNARRLFPDYKNAEISYYRNTGLFPIMHVVVIKNSILEREPWVGVNLLQAFQEAKTYWVNYLRNPPRISLAWASALWEEEKGILGEDPWSFNISDDVSTIEILMDLALQEGLISAKYAVKSLFAESTHNF